MSERDLNRAVARATGEPVESIQRLGFQLLGDASDDDFGPRVIDWDSHRSAYLADVLSDDDWPGRSQPLPSHDEEFIDELDEEYACAVA